MSSHHQDKDLSMPEQAQTPDTCSAPKAATADEAVMTAAVPDAYLPADTNTDTGISLLNPDSAESIAITPVQSPDTLAQGSSARNQSPTDSATDSAACGTTYTPAPESAITVTGANTMAVSSDFAAAVVQALKEEFNRQQLKAQKPFFNSDTRYSFQQEPDFVPIPEHGAPAPASYNQQTALELLPETSPASENNRAPIMGISDQDNVVNSAVLSDTPAPDNLVYVPQASAAPGETAAPEDNGTGFDREEYTYPDRSNDHSYRVDNNNCTDNSNEPKARSNQEALTDKEDGADQEAGADQTAEVGTTKTEVDRATGTNSDILAQLNAEARAQGFIIVQVGINRALYQTFDYKLKYDGNADLRGCRVKGSFGQSRRANEIGIIIAIGASSNYPYKKLKECTLMEEHSLIAPDVFKMMLFAAHYYHYPLGQTLPLALPKPLRDGGEASYREIPGLCSDINPVMLENCLLKLRSVRQRELLIELQSGPKSRRELREQGFTSQQEQALIKRKFAHKTDLAQNRPQIDLARLQSLTDAEASAQILAQQPYQLNDEQSDVLAAINAEDGFNVFLLCGITGSGKTEVYLQAIEHTLKQGKKALILVPEIALTPQTFRRFYSRFKVPIATMHSGLTQRERLDAFMDISTSRAAILIGTRSALFASIPDLGLIVIDEEHDSSFKQGDGLRYHARTLALYRAKQCQCRLILGSATPSLESVYYAQTGYFKRLDLLKRALNARKPEIILNDLSKEEQNAGVMAGIGRTLENAVGAATAQHHQALLFLNRRGFFHSMVCLNCGRVLTCPNCDTQFTVHRSNGMLRCHICNTARPIPQVCPYCHTSNTLVEMGLGTEQVESYLKERFMDVGVERIDRDNIENKSDLDAALDRIARHESEIIVGTQMIAKGHDFPDVTIAGILDIDAGLFCDDFRGLEYTAQLITQVAGRAGRADKAGYVFIQTRVPEHPLLQKLISSDFNYIELACELLAIRQKNAQPPFTYQASVMTNSSDREQAFNALKYIFSEIQQKTKLLQPLSYTSIMSDRIEKKYNRYHFHVTITAEDRSSLSRLLAAAATIFSQMKNIKDLRFAIDVDPIINY